MEDEPVEDEVSDHQDWRRPSIMASPFSYVLSHIS